MAEKRGRMKQPLAIAGLLDTVFNGLPLEKRLREARIWLVWNEAVGAQVAAKAGPVSLRDGVLTVRVAGSAWLQQLSMLKFEMIDQLNTAAGETIVRDIFFKQGGPVAPEQERPAERRRRRKLSPAEKERLLEMTEAVADPELRDTLIALCAAQLAGSSKANP